VYCAETGVCSDVSICPKACRTHPQLYARKFLICFPKSELIDRNNVSGAKELRADGAHRRDLAPAGADRPGMSLAVHRCPQAAPGIGTLILKNSRAVPVLLPRVLTGRPAWSTHTFGCEVDPCR